MGCRELLLKLAVNLPKVSFCVIHLKWVAIACSLNTNIFLYTKLNALTTDSFNLDILKNGDSDTSLRDPFLGRRGGIYKCLPVERHSWYQPEVS